MLHSVSSIVTTTCRGWSSLAVELILGVDVFALAPCMCVEYIVDVVECSGVMFAERSGFDYWSLILLQLCSAGHHL